MDTAEIIWGWMNGLVRRVAIGSLLFLLFSAASLLLYLAAVNRVGGLGELDASEFNHTKLVDSFIDMGQHASELAGSSSRAAAMDAIEPLRRSLIDARKANLSKFACAGAWIEGLENLQRVPAILAANCDGTGEKCEVSHDRIKLDDLAGFEQGMASVEDVLPQLEHACLGPQSKDGFCIYYRRERERDIQALNALVSSHYGEYVPKGIRLKTGQPESPCRAERGYLRSWKAVASKIDPMAGPVTLADFERLGETVSQARVAIRSSDSQISAAPGGGILTLLIPKSVSFPLLHWLGLVAICYAYMNLRRLLSLTRSHQLDGDHTLYGLYPTTSHVFTSPAFGRSAELPRRLGTVVRFPARVTAVLFDWIPYIAAFVAICALALAYLLGPKEAEEFSGTTKGISAAAVFLQVSVTVAFWRAQTHLSKRFEIWIQPIAPNPNGAATVVANSTATAGPATRRPRPKQSVPPTTSQP
ncbi:MAG: hypothetical protein JWL96_3643 [Sphingomonas bacterium]|uniref:hypothetical protein n=1 Tax=Sphingomonas bacterium TaxID=1895847 RepID=UPI002631040B|nr:hypothetical protein [Sphingomonas bacterium]MDB5711573.1 hypothetical protein [Sphingomonas bacterium]